MTAKRKKSNVATREARVLAAVYEFAKEGLDPSANAVALLLRGDYALEQFSYLKMYGTLRSYSPRKLKTMVTAMLKKGYLSEYSPPPFQERYLLLTPSGEVEASTLLKKSKSPAKALPNIPLFNERK